MLKEQCIEFKTERDTVFQTIKALRLELQEKVKQNEDLAAQKAQIQAQFAELNQTSIVQFHAAKNQRLQEQNDMQQEMVAQLQSKVKLLSQRVEQFLEATRRQRSPPRSAERDKENDLVAAAEQCHQLQLKNIKLHQQVRRLVDQQDKYMSEIQELRSQMAVGQPSGILKHKKVDSSYRT